MDLKYRLQTALREDGNVVALAGTAALSLALLNPVPVLIGLVAETIYLLYVPDSRWYSNRLTRRHDAEVRDRRIELRKEQFAAAPAAVVGKWDALESLRDGITERHGSQEKEWLKFLRRLDYLLELQVHMLGNSSAVCAQVADSGSPDGANQDRLSEGHDRLAYYETTTKALYDIAQGITNESSRTGLHENIAQVERQQNHMRRELFDIIAGQHLAECAEITATETHSLLLKIRDADGTGAMATWEAEAQRLIHDSGQSCRRLSDWLKQNP